MTQIFTALYTTSYTGSIGGEIAGSVLASRHTLEAAKQLIQETVSGEAVDAELKSEKVINGNITILKYEVIYKSLRDEMSTAPRTFIIHPNDLS